jgi:hypothetical protein
VGPDVSDLAAESGPLLRVTGVAAAGGRFRSLDVRVASGVLSLRCDDDSDEIILEVGRSDPSALAVTDSWELRNHRGYTDGFQLRLMNDEREEACRQFEVAGSVIDVRLVSPDEAAGEIERRQRRR